MMATDAEPAAWSWPQALVATEAVVVAIILALLCVQRAAPIAQDTSLRAWIATVLSLGGPFLMRVDILRNSSLVLYLSWSGVCFAVIADLVLIGMGRSFAIMPARRRVKTDGPFKLVRHPAYAAQLLALLCVPALCPTFWNGAVFLTTLIAVLTRISAEEAVLGGAEEYRHYAARVRWRLVPGVW